MIAVATAAVVIANLRSLPFTRWAIRSAGLFASNITGLSLPLSNWTALGGVTEVTLGQFLFTDPQATNLNQRFYRVRTPYH